jgi:hypothetical protein
MLLPVGGNLELRVHGANGNDTVRVPSAQFASNGLVGSIVLAQFIAPLPGSIVAALDALVPPPTTAAPPPITSPSQLPTIRIGEDEGCLFEYSMNNSVDRFPFGVFFRLVEPRASIVSQAQSHLLAPNAQIFLPTYASSYEAQVLNPAQPAAQPGALPATPPGVPGEGQVTYVDRVPVEQPISVDGFRDQMMGLQLNGTFAADETRPMAGTLGLGYILSMAQRWTFQGLTLGNLVYSLPLAPGEQQEVAIFERVDTARVTETEFFSEEQAQQQVALADTSTQATFNSAFDEAIRGTSHFDTDSTSDSWGGSLILISGGSGSSHASGNSTQTLEGQRDIAQQAAQSTHSSAENQAFARRSAARTGMRLATASESQQVTTKVITNHNHTRALTMQYWEVLRLYDVTTAIDGLMLTVLVPLQVVRFMPPGQPAVLSNPNQVANRAQVLARFSAIIKHGDVLAQALPRRFQHGLGMLLQFAADPTVDVSAFGGAAEDVIQLQLGGTFLPCEDVFITAVTDRGTRVGPVRLTNTAAQIPRDQFASREQLIDWLLKHRQSGATLFTGALTLPPSMNRNNIVGFECSRNFQQVSYTLISPTLAELKALENQLGTSNAWVNQALQAMLSPSAATPTTVFLSPAELESAVGGPALYNFEAAIVELDASGNPTPSPQEQYANESLNGVVLPSQPYPIPARQLAPVLRYNEILEIERMATHVVRNTLTYSRAIWSSMSEGERAILLEAYTIGVPPGGVPDATQMVPLLNCVENRVLGYFGNSMILPFIIPEALAQDGDVLGQLHPGQIQEALLSYQIAAFKPPHSTIALPTRGVLGEAVLGHCASAEKIDLTRFWNWQDSPADTAPTIAPTTLPTTSTSIAGGLTAPNSLSNLPSLINNVLTAPAPDTSLLQDLAKLAASQQDFNASLTGAAQLAGLVSNAQNTANLARADALKTTKDLTAQAMATVGNIVGGMKGNPTAGSSAAAAVSGKGDGTSPPPGGKTGTPGSTTTNPGGNTGTPGSTTTNPSGNTGPSSGPSSGPGGKPLQPGPTPAPGPPSGQL